MALLSAIPTNIKTCKRAGHTYTVYGKHNKGCRECNKTRLKEKYAANPKARKDFDLQRYYGITLEQYNTMLIEQDHSCAICQTHQIQLGKPLSVDHDHKSGKVRKLLCTSCNAGLGQFKDKPRLLQIAIDYLKENK